MSDSKTLAERALRCVNAVKDLPMHEKIAVLQLMNTLLGAEQREIELSRQAAQMPQMQYSDLGPVSPVADERYQ
jgi:hypothetical protein